MVEEARKLEIDDEPAADLSAAETERLRHWLREFRRTEGLDKTALARRLKLGKHGRNDVSKFIADGRLDSSINFARVIKEAQALRHITDGAEGAKSVVEFTSTRCVNVVMDHLDRVRDARLLGAVVGPYGAGKSYALRKAQELSRSNGKIPIRIIRCRTTMNLSALVSKVAINMGLIEREGPRISTLHEDIVRRLVGYPEFLVFDEIDHLTHDRRCLEFIRDLYDEIGMGMLLAGQMYFLNWVWQKADFRSGAGDGKRIAASGPLAPFADRLSIAIAPGLDDEEIVDITEVTMKADLAEDASSRLTRFIEHDFRALCDVLRVMRRKPGGVITLKTVETAIAESNHIKSTI